MLTLFGHVLAIGIVVDDAIVVVENVERNIAEGFGPREAAHRTISISHLGNIALRLGRTSAKWDPKAEKFVNDTEADGLLKTEYRKPWMLA